jgi:UDP-glucose 4-epimerase
MSETLFWVVGSGGLLGSHLRRAISQRVSNARFWQSDPPHFSWTKPTKLAEELSHAVATFASAVRAKRSAWILLWCAGKGVMSSSVVVLEPERWAWSRLLDLLSHYLAGPHDDLPGAIFLASSVGGVYSGNLGALLTEHTPPRPASDYGTHKFRMEQALRDWVEMFPNTSCLIGRISNLYGPGQDLDKDQGIISHLSRCLIYRRPVNIYVSLDTRRDYLFADDCAHQIAASLSRLMTEHPRAILKIFASEESTSLARIVGVFFRISKHRPLIVSRLSRSTQPTGLKLRSEVWRSMRGLRKTDLAAGIHLVHEHQLALFRHGLLPPPS